MENFDRQMSASLANILVLPPVHEKIKKLFYKIAIDHNIDYRCYKVALKLIKSYDKQLRNKTESDIDWMNEIKQICNDNMQGNSNLDII